MADENVLNFDVDSDYEYDFPALLQTLMDTFRKAASDVPEGSTIRRNVESAMDMIMSGPLGKIIKQTSKDIRGL